VAILLLWCALFASVRPDQAAGSSPVADSVFEELNRWRRAQKVRELGRNANLDVAAQRRANEVAARSHDERLTSQSDLRTFLQRAGVRSIARASEYKQTQRGYDDPADYAIERWRSDAQARRMALDADWHAVGIATTRAEDGTLVLVAILVENVDTRADLVAMERRAEQLVNDARRGEGLPPLAHLDALSEIARDHSRDMARNDYLAHEDDRGNGPDWRVRQRRIRYRSVAENVAKNQGWKDPVARAVEDWLQSPGHRHNIMNRALTQAGVGIALDRESGTYYFTQLFLRPATGS